MMRDFVPLVTDEYKLAFCQVTNALCTDMQRIIWKNVNEITEPKCPPAPRKPSAALANLLKRASIKPK